jgi:hypothetical protein
MAERVGFEPTIPFLTGYRFSRAGPSAARQPLQHPQSLLYRLDQYNFLTGHVNNLVLMEADSPHTFCGSFIFIT